jgi:hypothetical protein
MAATVEGSIVQALFSRLDTLALTPALPISWPNLNFTAPASRKYLRVQFVPNTNNRVFIGSEAPHQRLGLLQVVLHWPLNQGESAPRDIAGQIAAHFPTDLRLVADVVEVRVTEAPTVANLLVTETDVQIPVIVPWETWA